MDFPSDFRKDEEEAARPPLAGAWTVRARIASNYFSAHVLLRRQLHDSAHSPGCECDVWKENTENFVRAFAIEAFLWDRERRGHPRCPGCGEILACPLDEQCYDCYMVTRKDGPPYDAATATGMYDLDDGGC